MQSTGPQGRPLDPGRSLDPGGPFDPGGLLDVGRWVAGKPGAHPDPGLPLLPRVGEEVGFTLARVAVLVSAAIGADRVFRLPQAWAILAVVLLLALTPAARTWPVAAAGAGVTWLLGTGFLSNRFGELSFGSSDRAHLALLAVAAVVAVAIGRRAATVARTAESTGEKGE